MTQIQDASIQLPAVELSSTLTGTALGVVGAPRVDSPRKVMVIVHGAGSFPADYYKPLVAAIEQRLGSPLITFRFTMLISQTRLRRASRHRSRRWIRLRSRNSSKT
jgi:hypothetical protein